MTAEIIPFKLVVEPEMPEDEFDGPHLTGAAICSACEHEFTAVAPVGEVHLECPKCHRFWGAFKHAVRPEKRW